MAPPEAAGAISAVLAAALGCAATGRRALQRPGRSLCEQAPRGRCQIDAGRSLFRGRPVAFRGRPVAAMMTLLTMIAVRCMPPLRRRPRQCEKPTSTSRLSLLPTLATCAFHAVLDVAMRMSMVRSVGAFVDRSGWG
jgi:hypothetical protein